MLSGNVYDISVDSKISAIDESHFDCSGATVLQQFFTSNVSGKPATVIMNVASCTALTNGFIYSANLETVELKNIRENCTFQNTFLGCSGLVNFRCSGTIGKNISFVNSNLLSNESVQIIIGHLKDLTGQAAQTLTLHPTVGAKLTNEQKTSVSAKNWTLVY